MGSDFSNSVIARRYRDIASAIMADQGGADQCSETRQQLIKRFAAAAVLAERMEAQLTWGEEIDITEHALLCGSLVRIAQIIGVDLTTRALTTTLAEYLEHKAEKENPK